MSDYKEETLQAEKKDGANKSLVKRVYPSGYEEYVVSDWIKDEHSVPTTNYLQAIMWYLAIRARE
jgi:hypothetical protein